jgi:hypothetical protein
LSRGPSIVVAMLGLRGLPVRHREACPLAPPPVKRFDLSGAM